MVSDRVQVNIHAASGRADVVGSACSCDVSINVKKGQLSNSGPCGTPRDAESTLTDVRTLLYSQQGYVFSFTITSL